MPILTNQRLTIDFVSGQPGKPDPEPGFLPLFSPDVRLVQMQTGDQRSFSMFGDRIEEYTLSAEETEQLLQMLAQMQISAPWNPLFGFDGTDCVLVMHDQRSSMEFSWWVKAPPEWESVGVVYEYVMRIAHEHSSPL